MHHFTIRDVENLSGIKAHTLRMWEQRHGICLCKRKESQHRYYDNEDLKQILRIAYLYHHGYRISKIAQFSPGEIIQLSSRSLAGDEYEVIVNQLVEASMDYNQEQFEKAFHAALNNMGLEKNMEKVVYPFMHKIGLLWMTSHVLPAQEHFSSHLIHKTIIAATNALPPATNTGCRFVLFTPEGEQHELPLLLMQYLLKKKGIKTVLLGKNIPLAVLQEYCAQQPVTHLYFHLITNFTNDTAEAYLFRMADIFAGMTIIASGPAVKEIAPLPANVGILHTLQEAMEWRIDKE